MAGESSAARSREVIFLPKLNRELKQQMKATLPLAFARPEDPLIGATLVGIIVRDGVAKVDDAVLHGRSDIERGIRFTQDRAAVTGGDVYHVVYVAMRGADGGLYYQGACAVELLIDRPNRRGFRDIAASVNRISDAVDGEVDLGAMSHPDREALVALLEERGRDVWQRTPESVRQRLTAE